MNRGRRLFDRVANAARRVVERVIPLLGRVGMMVVHTPDRVAAITADIEVFRLPRENECVHGKVRLDEPPVGKVFEARDDLRRHHAQIDPGRQVRDVDPFHAVENELAENLLNPGRP